MFGKSFCAIEWVGDALLLLVLYGLLLFVGVLVCSAFRCFFIFPESWVARFLVASVLWAAVVVVYLAAPYLSSSPGSPV